MLSNYLIFAGKRYTSLGGWKDLVGIFPTVDACQKVIDTDLEEFDWWQIVEVGTFDLILEGGNRVPENPVQQTQSRGEFMINMNGTEDNIKAGKMTVCQLLGHLAVRAEELATLRFQLAATADRVVLEALENESTKVIQLCVDIKALAQSAVESNKVRVGSSDRPSGIG